NQEGDIPYLIEDLANFLDIGETTIRFADSKDRSWKVVFEGASEINQSLNVGDFTLNFRCIEVTSYGEEVTGKVTMDTDEGTFFQIFNEGTAETHPVMKITFEEDSPMVNIVGMGESENVTLGYDSSEGTGTGTNFDPMPWQFSEFYDNMNSLKQMDNNTTPSFLLYQDFIRNTTLETTVGTLKLKNNKFPKVDRKTVGYKWYGGGITRVNPKALNDFALEIAFSTQGNPQYWTDHHMYIILYDDQMIPFANVAFGYVAKQKKIRFHIATMGSSTQDEVRISPGWGGKEWYNFTGKITIERKDNRWRLQAGQFKSKKRSPMIGSDLQYGTSMLRNVRSTGFRSLPQETWNRKFAAYGVLYANIDNRPQINRWAVHHTKCWEILQKPANSPQITRSFKKDDELIVDFTKGQVWLNGTIAPSYVQPSTDWFSLKPGKNTLGISGVKGKVEYEYTNRYK
ncbi:phage distal tail protein, partial [Ellagibacter isourolithinifaciens]|uniref:phage distal tail protein n=1 Tax=Ellagibacter isourolithinifaciens TaxID=2137581 RepID=UPI003F8C8B4B